LPSTHSLGAPESKGLKRNNETPCRAILNKQKRLFFFFKNGEQEGKTGPVWRLVYWEGEDIRKECRRMNVVEILCTHI
jgi:hypothetical protein